MNVLSSWWQAWARPGQQASSWRQSLKRIINVSAAERRHAVWKQVSLSLHLIIQATAAESTPPEAYPAQQHQQQRERERILKRASKSKSGEISTTIGFVIKNAMDYKSGLMVSIKDISQPTDLLPETRWAESWCRLARWAPYPGPGPPGLDTETPGSNQSDLRELISLGRNVIREKGINS